MDEQERKNIWIAIDNLQSSISTLVEGLGDYLNAPDRERINENMQEVIALI